MAILEAMQRMAKDRGATLSEKKGLYTFRLLIAERKAFLSKKRLEYIARFRIDDGSREVRFSDKVDELSNEGEAYLRSTGWNYRIPTWYFYFRRVEYPADPDVNGAWEWAGVYFGEKL